MLLAQTPYLSAVLMNEAILVPNVVAVPDTRDINAVGFSTPAQALDAQGC
jgi:hypothetical protein